MYGLGCVLAVHAVAIFGKQGRKIVYVWYVVGFGVRLYSCVKTANFLHSVFDFGSPTEVAGRQTGSQDDLDFVKVSHLHHRDDVAIGQFFIVSPCVFSDVIGSIIEDNHLGLQLDDVLSKTQEELEGSLSADASADIAMLFEEVGVLLDPSLRDGVAHKHDAFFTFGRLSQSGVVLCISFIVREFVMLSHCLARRK